MLVFGLTARAALMLALMLPALTLLTGKASAFSIGVKLACASDYYAHCSAYSLDSQEVRQCMRSVGPRLSHGCVDALVAAGEVSAEEVARRRSASKTAAN